MLGLGITSAYWLQAQDLNDQTQQRAQQRLQHNARHQTIVDSFPAQTAAPEQLAQTVTLARQLNAPQPNALGLFAAVGQAMDAEPDITLNTLEWVDDTLMPAGQVNVNIDASLATFDGNYRAAMQRIERFMSRLQAVPTVFEVRLRSSPVNADSSSTLSGKTFGPDTADAPVVRFGLSLTYREAPP